MKNWIDIIFIIAIIVSFFRGWKAGFISTILVFIGYIGGGLLGLTLGLHFFHSRGVTKFVLLFIVVTIGAAIGEGIFKQIGKVFHHKILFGPFKWIDSLLGAAFSILSTLIMMVILGHLLLITPWSWAQHNIPQSKIYTKLNNEAPSIISDITKRAEQTIH
ncbi:MAG: CvpA family protein [Actinomycetota bacterium]